MTSGWGSLWTESGNTSLKLAGIGPTRGEPTDPPDDEVLRPIHWAQSVDPLAINDGIEHKNATQNERGAIQSRRDESTAE